MKRMVLFFLFASICYSQTAKIDTAFFDGGKTKVIRHWYDNNKLYRVWTEEWKGNGDYHKQYSEYGPSEISVDVVIEIDSLFNKNGQLINCKLQIDRDTREKWFRAGECYKIKISTHLKNDYIIATREIKDYTFTHSLIIDGNPPIRYDDVSESIFARSADAFDSLIELNEHKIIAF